MHYVACLLQSSKYQSIRRLKKVNSCARVLFPLSGFNEVYDKKCLQVIARCTIYSRNSYGFHEMGRSVVYFFGYMGNE